MTLGRQLPGSRRGRCRCPAPGSACGRLLDRIMIVSGHPARPAEGVVPAPPRGPPAGALCVAKTAPGRAWRVVQGRVGRAAAFAKGLLCRAGGVLMSRRECFPGAGKRPERGGQTGGKQAGGPPELTVRRPLLTGGRGCCRAVSRSTVAHVRRHGVKGRLGWRKTFVNLHGADVKVRVPGGWKARLRTWVS